MIALQISDIKNFMNLLLASDHFSPFSLVEAHLIKDIQYHIDGTLDYDTLDQDKKELFQSKKLTHIPFLNVQNQLFQLIKGTSTPSYMKYVLKLQAEAFLDPIFSITNCTPSLTDSFYLNILFSNGKLLLTSGVSTNNFLQEHIVSKEWDNGLEIFLKKCKIFYETLN